MPSSLRPKYVNPCRAALDEVAEFDHGAPNTYYSQLLVHAPETALPYSGSRAWRCDVTGDRRMTGSRFYLAISLVVDVAKGSGVKDPTSGRQGNDGSTSGAERASDGGRWPN